MRALLWVVSLVLALAVVNALPSDWMKAAWCVAVGIGLACMHGRKGVRCDR